MDAKRAHSELGKNPANYVPLTPLSFLARSAAVYGRTGSCLGRRGTLVSFLLDALVRLAQCGLGVEAGVARRGDHIEQQLAEEILIVDVEREIQPRRLDLHARRPLEHALRREERRELARNAAQEGLRAIALLLPLYLLPLREQISAGDRLSFEHVRMPADELLVQAPRDLVRVERALLASELRVDRVELRHKNLIAPEAMPYKTPLVFTYDTGRFAENLDRAMRQRNRLFQMREGSRALFEGLEEQMAEAGTAIAAARLDAVAHEIADQAQMLAFIDLFWFIGMVPFAILPLKGNRSSIVWTEDKATGKAIMAADEATFLAELANAVTGTTTATIAIATNSRARIRTSKLSTPRSTGIRPQRALRIP